jgi:hypothetical protein
MGLPSIEASVSVFPIHRGRTRQWVLNCQRANLRAYRIAPHVQHDALQIFGLTQNVFVIPGLPEFAAARLQISMSRPLLERRHERCQIGSRRIGRGKKAETIRHCAERRKREGMPRRTHQLAKHPQATIQIDKQRTLSWQHTVTK